MSVERFNKELDIFDKQILCSRCNYCFDMEEMTKQDNGTFICQECQYKITGNLKGE